MADRPTVAIETHGCKLNQADSMLAARRFAEAGFRLVAPGELADVFVVNTCTVTHVADRKARHALRSGRRRNPDALVIAAGCYASRDPDRIREMDGIDLVVGNADKRNLVRRVLEWRGGPPIPLGAGAEAFSQMITRTRAMVRIQEGCNQVCTFCVVPRVRGRERSVGPQEIVREIDWNLARGCKEVVLTGTQLGSYGFDLPDTDLTRLLERILLDTHVPRLRVSSLQPQDVSPEMLELWSDRRLCGWLRSFPSW